MPTLPTVKRESLTSACASSLVSVRAPDDRVFVGLRIWVVDRDQSQAGFVALGAAPDAVLIQAMPRTPTEFPVDGNTRVLNHGHQWSLQVEVKDWDPRVLMNFAPQHAGLVLAEEVNRPDTGLSLAVNLPGTGACQLLHFHDWTLRPPAPGQQLDFAAAKRWKLTLPGAGVDVQLPLT